VRRKQAECSRMLLQKIRDEYERAKIEQTRHAQT
jgi:hypothetical protein